MMTTSVKHTAQMSLGELEAEEKALRAAFEKLDPESKEADENVSRWSFVTSAIAYRTQTGMYAPAR